MIQTLNDSLFKEKGITVDVLRLDLIHPEVSGNKWFKLKYYIADALLQGKQGIFSFGGPYSNHLVAMAFACKEKKLMATAIIRGDEAGLSNPSIEQMRSYAMKLLFVSREEYRDKEKLRQLFIMEHPDYYCVPEGGQGRLGVKGASEIVHPSFTNYSDIICSVGTGTTMAGIINGAQPPQIITGICSLKVKDTSHNALLDYISENVSSDRYRLLFDYHFGGYAKKNAVLVDFMNRFYSNENIPTDFVYTGKLFYAVYDLAKKDFFTPGQQLLVVHSGGLQGNRSLPPGVLDF